MKTSISQTKFLRAAVSLALLGLFLTIGGITAFAQNPSISAAAAPPPANGKRVFIRSTALLVRAAVVEEKLMKRPEFTQLGLVITRDEASADIILELRHDVLTKYVYSAIDRKTQTVLAGGKVSSLGGTVAGKVAKRFVKQLLRGRP